MSELGPYRLLRRLGAGGMGEVWEAQRLDGTGPRVALKTLPAGGHSTAALRRLLDEATIAAAMTHPNIVRVLDSGAVGGRSYFAMELLEGAPLSALLRRGQAVPPGAAVALALQALSALGYLHSATGVDGKPLGVIHRDIKPSNLFLTKEGRLKLIDFGLARASTLVDATLTRTGAFRGTLAYASPEQVKGEALDARGDLFSLGLILFELLAARRVFPEQNEAALLGSVLWSPIPALESVAPEVPAALARAVAWALQRDPVRRPESPGALGALLERSLLPEAPWSEERLARWLRELGALPQQEGNGTASVELSPLVAELPRKPVGVAPGEPRSGRRSVVTAVAGLAALLGLWTFTSRSSSEGSAAPEAAVAGKLAAPDAGTSRPGPQSPLASGDSGAPLPAASQVDRERVLEKGIASTSKRSRPRVARARPSVTAAESQEPALLTVDSKPVWARLFLNGRDVGTTPLVRLVVKPGSHRLRAVRADGAVVEKRLVLSSGEEERLLLAW